MPSSLAGSPPTADTRKRATTDTPETENFGRQRQARQERARLSRHSTVTSAKTGSHTGCSRMTTASRTSYATLPRHIRVPRPATAPEPPVVQRVSMRRLQATGHAGGARHPMAGMLQRLQARHGERMQSAAPEPSAAPADRPTMLERAAAPAGSCVEGSHKLAPVEARAYPCLCCREIGYLPVGHPRGPRRKLPSGSWTPVLVVMPCASNVSAKASRHSMENFWWQSAHSTYLKISWRSNGAHSEPRRGHPSWYECAPQHHGRRGGLAFRHAARCKCTGTRATRGERPRKCTGKGQTSLSKQTSISLRCRTHFCWGPFLSLNYMYAHCQPSEARAKRS